MTALVVDSRAHADYVLHVSSHALRRSRLLVGGSMLPAPQSTITPRAVPSAGAPQAEVLPPKQVEVEPSARDDEIGARIEGILASTGWFEEAKVRVKNGVVFLTGTAEQAEYKTWATNLVHNTQDVVAVVNKMEVLHSSAWDLKPVLLSLRDIWTSLLHGIPYFVSGLMVLLATLFAASHARRGTERILRQRVTIPLLRELIGRALAIILVIVGLYLVLKISGTTQLALTVLGGTGLFGLVLGIAFRDITENFLASIFLSIQRPFQAGDLVEIVGIVGYVDRLTVRTTIVIALDGNYVQIPNATVYKNTIRNYSNNPSRRDEFTIGIPYNKPIADAQDTALKILNKHPAVLKQPEPWVLVDRIGTSTVDLRIYYWVDCVQTNLLTVRSSVMRLVMNAFAQAKLVEFAGPGEMIFPRGLDVHIVRNGHETKPHSDGSANRARRQPQAPVATDAEGTFDSPAAQISEQAQQARPLEVGPNLLQSTAEPRRSNQETPSTTHDGE